MKKFRNLSSYPNEVIFVGRNCRTEPKLTSHMLVFIVQKMNLHGYVEWFMDTVQLSDWEFSFKVQITFFSVRQ